MIATKCHPGRKHYGHGLCGSCYQIAWMKRCPNQKQRRKLLSRKSALKTKYGLTLERFKLLKKRQQFKCALCRRRKKLNVDHDHKTGKVRGLLCLQCNSGLGIFEAHWDMTR